jgi:hypothetical protein|nr:MAG TPA: putative periplasmic lipoprotein [Caudoviricetes sp.]
MLNSKKETLQLIGANKKTMNKLKRNLIGKDKLLHSKVGNCMLVLFFTPFLKFCSVGIAFVLALATVLLAGLAKELYDKYIKRTFIDWWDIVASVTPYPIVKKINKKR